MIDTNRVQISVSICKIIESAADQNPTHVPIEYIDKILVSGPNMSLDLFNGNGTFETFVILDKALICKEIPIPDVEIKNIIIIHQIGMSDMVNKNGKWIKADWKNIKIFVHMRGAILLRQFLEEIDPAILTNNEMPFYNAFLKMENFDKSHGIDCMDENQGYDECFFNDALNFMNETLGCSLPLIRFVC